MTLHKVLETLPCRTDKFDLGYIEEFYEKLFFPIQDTAKNVLELGIQSGDSMILWREYFTNALITGIDIRLTENLYPFKRIKQIKGDAYTEKMVSKFDNEFFDVIIDDGPHTDESQFFFLREYFKLLKPGGIMVLEDIINTNITQDLANVIDQSNATVEIIHMAGKQKTEQLTSLWSKGLDVIIVRKNKE